MKPLLLILFAACASPLVQAAPPAPRAAPTPAATTTPASKAAPERRLNPAELAAASPVPIWRRNGILVEQGGRALYTFTDDTLGQSRCDQRCEALWPPHYAEPGAKAFGPFTLARSSSGRAMWAWEGKPLYRWVSDRKRGAAGGDGVADVWFLVKVPADKLGWVTPYFPMPMPRPGQPAAKPTSTTSSRT